MYVKQAPIKQIRYYLLTLGLVSLFQLIVAVNIIKVGNGESTDSEFISEADQLHLTSVSQKSEDVNNISRFISK
ncbi:MAG: hypothetical protein HKN92_01215 [Chitinophagales bacterium]|nr:hypothetical protein [Chitinophagales bacterium]